ncbi:MAG TPA: 50S ribosomal protein L20 [Candidatus Omnitrophota bacterium]|nr:50S ribosomal protein L20 [Candidatus Omnitrophota bacterium]HPN87944.1 50S ribosomal protein L20 [Candidatus Omnitrophota bacterium]
MVRVRTNVARHKRVKRVLKQTKGQFGHRSRRYKQARKSLMRGLVYHYRDRKVKKRQFRNIWVLRINAACREVGMTYSRFMSGLKKAKVVMNRKMLSELATNAPDAFNKLVAVAQKALA